MRVRMAACSDCQMAVAFSAAALLAAMYCWRRRQTAALIAAGEFPLGARVACGVNACMLGLVCYGLRGEMVG